MRLSGSINDQLEGRWDQVYAAVGLRFEKEVRSGDWINCLDPFKESRTGDRNAGYSIQTGFFKLFSTGEVLSPWQVMVRLLGQDERYWRDRVAERMSLQVMPDAEFERHVKAKELYESSVPAGTDSICADYLRSRGIEPIAMPFCRLLYMPYYEEQNMIREKVPHMLHPYIARGETGVSVIGFHTVPLNDDGTRMTYRKKQGQDYVECKGQKKSRRITSWSMTGALIPVFTNKGSKVLAITEGVENAYATAEYTDWGVNVVAAGSASMLASWTPNPQSVERYSSIWIFGDSDPTGIADAVNLWRRLLLLSYTKTKKIRLCIDGVDIEPTGKDILDLLVERKKNALSKR